MPELPEVETIARDLNKVVRHTRITHIEFFDQRIRLNCSQKQFARRILGHEILNIRRRGKAIVFSLRAGCGFLVVQLMMTGQLIIGQNEQKHKHTKVVFRLSNQHYLHYNDQRLFGRLYLVKQLEQVPYLQALGPEPLGRLFSVLWLRKALSTRTMPIKTLLMNHQFLAGIGNIYASEILHDCRIHPARRANSLHNQEVEKLFRSTIKILKEAVRYRGTSMDTYRDSDGREGQFKSRVRVYGREDEDCLRCQTPLVKIVLSGRSTFFCEKCQPLQV